ncbi:unnamed protein product [Symbiodinium sp. CCMP2592]|nr:unnamed protein product [Symbiodinium sp. CCMP2592]
MCVCVCVPQPRWSLSAVNLHPPCRVSFSAEVAAAVTDVFMRWLVRGALRFDDRADAHAHEPAVMTPDTMAGGLQRCAVDSKQIAEGYARRKLSSFWSPVSDMPRGEQARYSQPQTSRIQPPKARTQRRISKLRVSSAMCFVTVPCSSTQIRELRDNF